MDTKPDYYFVLGVRRDASDEVIKAAYKAMAKKWHTDTNDSEEAEERIKQINQAGDILCNPERRKQYDHELDADAKTHNVEVKPGFIDFGDLEVGGPSADAQITLSWSGPTPSVKIHPPSDDWWYCGEPDWPDENANCVVFPLHAEAYDGISSGRHSSHIDLIVDGVAHRVELVMTVVAAPSKPPSTPPGPGGGYMPPSSPPPTRPPLPPPGRPPRPPVVVRPARRRRGSMTAVVTVALALIAILAYVLWPSTPPTKYLVSDVQDHGAYITSIAYSPNTAMVASAGADNAFDWSNVDGSGAGSAGGYAAACDAVAYTPDNAYLISGCGAGLSAWTVGDPSGNSPTDLGSTAGSVNAIAFSPTHSGNQYPFAVATSRGVELWTYTPGNASSDANFDGYTTLPSSSSVVSIAYSPDGTLLAGLSTPQIYGTGRIEIWNVESGKLQTSFADPYALQVAFSPDGNTLAISTLTSIQFWNVTTGHLSTIIKYGPYDPLGPGGAIAYSPNGSILAFADGWDKIDLWSLNENKLVGSLPASASGRGLVYSLAFSSDSMDLVSGGGNSSCSNACDDSSVHIWDVSSFTQ